MSVDHRPTYSLLLSALHERRQCEIARETDLSESTISKLVSGNHLEHVAKVIVALGFRLVHEKDWRPPNYIASLELMGADTNGTYRGGLA